MIKQNSSRIAGDREESVLNSNLVLLCNCSMGLSRCPFVSTIQNCFKKELRLLSYFTFTRLPSYFYPTKWDHPQKVIYLQRVCGSNYHNLPVITKCITLTFESQRFLSLKVTNTITPVSISIFWHLSILRVNEIKRSHKKRRSTIPWWHSKVHEDSVTN